MKNVTGGFPKRYEGQSDEEALKEYLKPVVEEIDDKYLSDEETAAWEEFRSSGLLWFINMNLHIFGWNIVVSKDKGRITSVLPVRTKNRGFSEESNNKGYAALRKLMDTNIPE